MRIALALVALCFFTSAALAAGEKPVNFIPAKADPLVGDWQGSGGMVAQVALTNDGSYQVNLLKAFDAPEKPVAVLRGAASGEQTALTGDGWNATIRDAHLIATK